MLELVMQCLHILRKKMLKLGTYTVKLKLIYTVFPVVMYGCESWTIKKAEHQIIDTFKLWYWRRLLKVPWTAEKSNKSMLKVMNPEYSLEGLMLKLKLQ